jgi:hypothetical protein
VCAYVFIYLYIYVKGKFNHIFMKRNILKNEMLYMCVGHWINLFIYYNNTHNFYFLFFLTNVT